MLAKYQGVWAWESHRQVSTFITPHPAGVPFLACRFLVFDSALSGYSNRQLQRALGGQDKGQVLADAYGPGHGSAGQTVRRSRQVRETARHER